MDRKTLIVICFFLLLIPLLQATFPADWWGKVTINGNSGNNGAIIDAYIDGDKVASATVGQYASEYYLIHVPGHTGNSIRFKVNGTNAGELQDWVFGSHELDFSVEIEPEEESPEEDNISSFSDLDTCKNGMQGNLKVNIREPDDGDEFNPGETIEVEVKVENDADEDKKIIVEAILYNTDEDDEEVKVKSGDEKIDEGEDEKFKLELEIPEDAEDDDYILFVKAYEKGEEENQCNYELIEIDMEKEKHNVVIEDLSFEKEIYAGKNLNIFIEVKNTGKHDEEVYISVKVDDLGISEESESFELDDGDSYTQTISVKIPENAEKGEYGLKAEVIFDNDKNSREENFEIIEKTSPTIIAKELDTLEIQGKQKNIAKPSLNNKDFFVIDFFLGVGIIILAVLIILYKRR